MSRRLPYCDYPTAREISRHGVQSLPETLRPVDLRVVAPYRSAKWKVTPVGEFTPAQLLQIADVIAQSFALREPMQRFLTLPLEAPAWWDQHVHVDPLGERRAGEWTKTNLFHWVIRAFMLTRSDGSKSLLRNDVVKQSVAILDSDGNVIGAAINETMTHRAAAYEDTLNQLEQTLLSVYRPIISMIVEQEAEAMAAICGKFPEFHHALEHDKVGHFNLVARSDQMATEDAFELVAGSVEWYRELGFEYMITSAVNQWTGAAFTVLGGTPVHFVPFLGRKRVAQSAVAIDVVSSPTGFLSDKDSGSMIYVVRL